MGPVPYKVDLLCLGDELLLGLRDNSHLVYLGREMARYGLLLRRALVLRDDPEEIRAAFLRSWTDADVVITTGGLGPTDDDLTRETLADCLGRPLLPHPEAEQALRERFQRLGRTPTPNNWKQCQVLAGAEAIINHHGTAPGQYLRAAHQRLILLPGPANELRPMWREQILPRLQADGFAEESPPYLQIRTLGIGESLLETKIKPVLERYPGRLQVAYCAHAGAVDVRLRSAGHSLTAAQIESIGKEIEDLLGEDFLCFGEDPAAAVVLKLLRANDLTLAVAESCTGGLLSDAFTNIPGASKVYLGGVICYNNEIKEQLLDIPACLLQQHGAVSPECAVAMAIGVAERFASDYGLAITGFAGPGGGTSRYPVGTIFLGLASPHGAWSHQLSIPGDRQQVKARSVTQSIDFLRRKLLAYEPEKALHECLTLE